jgi:hypothetical protein
LIGPDPLLFSRNEDIAALASRHAVPKMYQRRELAAADGLMSYGPSLTDVYVRSVSIPAEFSKATGPSRNVLDHLIGTAEKTDAPKRRLSDSRNGRYRIPAAKRIGITPA